MAIMKSSSDKSIGQNIRELRKAGNSRDQSTAIAMRKADKPLKEEIRDQKKAMKDRGEVRYHKREFVRERKPWQ